MSMQSYKRRNESKLLKKSILVMQNWFRLLRELFFQTKGQEARVTILRIFIMSTNYTNNSLNQETINIFIVNMAVSDLIFPLVSIPFSLAGIAANSLQWPIRGLPGLIS